MDAMPPEKGVILIGRSAEGLSLPTEQSLLALYRIVIDFSRKLAGTDAIQSGLRYGGILTMLESRLKNRKYGRTPLQNALFVSEEILFKILCEHPFVDGNKRTALMSALFFLVLNVELYANKRPGRKYFVPFAILDAEDQLDKAKELELLAAWQDHKRQDELFEFLTKNGIRIRSKNKIGEEHVRQYLRKFLESWIAEKKG